MLPHHHTLSPYLTPLPSEFSYGDIASWDAIDRDTAPLNYNADPVRRPSHRPSGAINAGGNDSGIEIRSAGEDGQEGGGMTVFFAVSNIRDAKHTLEFYWNTYQVPPPPPPSFSSWY